MTEPWGALSPDQRKAVELVTDGKSRRAAGGEVGVSHVTVSKWLRLPDAIAYRQHLIGENELDLKAAVVAELRRRVVEWGGMRMGDLIALLRVLHPTEVNVTMQVKAEAQRIADAMGLSVDEVLAEAEAIVRGAR